MSQLDIFSILIGLTPVIIVAGAALVVWREQQRVRRVIPAAHRRYPRRTVCLASGAPSLAA